MKYIITLVVAAAIASSMVGCSSPASSDDAKVNSDVSTGTPPAQLEGSDNMGGGGGAGAPETPSSTPD